MKYTPKLVEQRLHRRRAGHQPGLEHHQRWNLTYNLPSGQQVTNAWNATVTQSGSAVSARNVSFNGSIAPGGTANFGYQGR
ncbi:cellulose binding domain-containing protein [Micromonospora sp. NPDC047620]|uniref:cellulose binding domain-containing protein n=1 Tax=Micromonospora sp. NPDC047620 TaxID=3364251 RepID=UPI0037241782